jgi:adenosylcobyric acid synthase
MVLGTASHAGKSLLTAALCRIFVQEGFSVAPFKAQNMALNSAATPDGLEIGRAQAMQAEAARIEPSVDMNPVLIKPSSDTTSQVIVHGRVWANLTAADYHTNRVTELFPLVVESYQRLAAKHDIIILEGAGSPAEINLKEHDIVNMRMAEAADAACILVGDIDRGGVFASFYGTLALLEPRERERIRGFLINKFRGDESLLWPGIKMIEERIHKPCVGVVHYLNDVGLDEEDGVALEDRRTPSRVWTRDDKNPDRPLRVGVVALPYMSNFTDFDALAREPSIALAYLSRPEEVSQADILILPGTKQTMGDLRWLKEKGFSQPIHAHSILKPLIGICGGMQMLGYEIADPENMEGGGSECGLELLPIKTKLLHEKITRRAKVNLLRPQIFKQPMACLSSCGYEIHLGETEYQENAKPLFRLTREGDNQIIPDGAISSNEMAFGTYLHGLFDDDLFRHAFILAARTAFNLSPPIELADVRKERDARFERLADHVRKRIDLNTIRSWIDI